MEKPEMSSCGEGERGAGFRGSVGFKETREDYRSSIALATDLAGSLSFALEFHLSRESWIASGRLHCPALSLIF